MRTADRTLNYPSKCQTAYGNVTSFLTEVIYYVDGTVSGITATSVSHDIHCVLWNAFMLLPRSKRKCPELTSSMNATKSTDETTSGGLATTCASPASVLVLCAYWLRVILSLLISMVDGSSEQEAISLLHILLKFRSLSLTWPTTVQKWKNSLYSRSAEHESFKARWTNESGRYERVFFSCSVRWERDCDTANKMAMHVLYVALVFMCSAEMAARQSAWSLFFLRIPRVILFFCLFV